MKLNYGVVTKYNDKGGFGFVLPLSFHDASREEIFFHISKVKKTGIEPTLIELAKGSIKIINLWFIIEDTDKGEALKDCWLRPAEIPNEYLVGFVENIEIRLAEMGKKNSFNALFNAKKITLERRVVNKAPLKHLKNTVVDSVISGEKLKHKYGLSLRAAKQLEEYIEIYRNNSFEEHSEVNNHITENKLWGNFSEMRSLNDHGKHKGVPGILPEFYSIVCEIVGIDGAGGAPLDKAERY